MRIYLESLGCRLNYAEMAALGRQLVGAGHELAASAAEADLCVLNSCAVTGEAARQSRQLARQLVRANPAARLIVTGCYATLEGGAVARLPNVALVVGNKRKDELLALIQNWAIRDQGQARRGLGPGSWLPVAGHQPSTPAPPWRRDVRNRNLSMSEKAGHAVRNTCRTRAFVKVQEGCRHRCTFCIVTVARGEECSRPIGEVVAEVNALHAEGYQEVVLTGVHLGGYGRDLGTHLAALIAALLAETDLPRLRLSSLEPFDLAPDFFDLWPMSAGRLMPHLHLPAQSGSDAVLRRMARRNRAADFEALVAAARARIPGLTVTTDLIAGFPGETEADFAETVAFARRIGFAHLHVFPYSARAGTAAARFNGQVPEAERKRRGRFLSGLGVELAAAVRASCLGQTRPVLWESSVEQPWAQPGFLQEAGAEPGTMVWSGLTDNYLRVFTSARAGLDLHNCITPVRLVRLTGNELWGELLAR